MGLWKPRSQSRRGQRLACHLACLGPVLCPPHTSKSFPEGTWHGHDGRAATPLGPHLAASSSSSSFTNCLGTCRESTLSAICSRIRRWLPSVVGKRYMRQMAPPNTEGRGRERLCVSRLQTLPVLLPMPPSIPTILSIKHLNQKPTR